MIRALKSLARRLPHGRRYYEDMVFRRVDGRALATFPGELAVRPGTTLYIQSSFGRMGYFRGGAQRFVELLRQLLGPSGTIVMPSFPFSGSMEAFVQTQPRFDLNATPALVGLLPEILRGMPGSRRSVHPTHPVVALGARGRDNRGPRALLDPAG